MFDFTGKKILITGASGGIGRELSKSFLENGADVIITGTNSKKLTQLNKDLNSMCKIIEQWEDVMLINLTSVMRITRGVIRGMIKKRWGRVINISSIVALTGNPGQSNYVAAKSGLIGFSKSLASEVASRGITVNCIAPGFINTNMTEKLNENQKNLILSKIPMNRIGLPVEICSSAIFLASSFSNYITGQTIHVNGGMYMS